MELLSYNILHTVYLFIFSLGLCLGLGGTVLWNFILFFANKDSNLSKEEFEIIEKGRIIIWAAILLYGFGGLGLFTLAYESMLALDIFYASVSIAIVMVINELIISFYSISHIKGIQNEHKNFLEGNLIIGGVVSIVSWVFLIAHHVLYRTDINYFLFLSMYLFFVFFGISSLYLIQRKFLDKNNRDLLKKNSFIILFLIFMLSFMWVTNVRFFEESKNKIEAVKPSVSTSTESFYNLASVSSHNNPEDCWLIVDELVFNVTEASKVHPALFNCGTDASVNYHKNHGKGIRDKMMKMYIGKLGEKLPEKSKDVKTKSYTTLNPTKELYVKESSWDPKELMVVVEKDAEKLLFIDGKTHKEIGRIHNVGFQPHTSVFSSDKKYMYLISRDGWITKIDVTTFDPVSSVRVGINSRGTALTDDDKFLAVGNYEPNNLVILDTSSMKVVGTIETSGDLDGEIIGSRVGVVVEKGQDFILALKDLSSVWVVGKNSKDEWGVKNKYWNIGGNKAPLHDGFLTSDGKFFIVAAQGANSVWVLDTLTWKEVGEVKTGKLPHTGPGASWGDTIYVPSLEEGLITAINTKTWKPVASIKTGGPGLFVRSYNNNPDYPYVWADTAFGDKKDEIYVIDARLNKITKTLIPVLGKNSWHPEFTYDGKFVYVVSQEGGEVVVYDANTFEVVERIKANTPSAVSNIGLRIEEPGL